MTTARWLNTGRLSAREVERWAELGRAAACPNPFYEPDFVLPALEHFGGRELELLVALDHAGGWVGLMPVERRRRWGRLLGAALTGWKHVHCFLESPLLARGSEDVAAEAMLREARQEAPLIAFDRLPVDGPAAAALASACRGIGAKPIIWKTFERAALKRRPEDDYVRSTVGSKHFRDLRRKGRKLESKLGELAVVERAGDPQAVEDFLTLEASGWKGDAGTALAGGPGAGFFRAICERFADGERLQMLALQAGDRVVAMQSALKAGEGLFCFKIAYDESLGRFSPGTRLMAETASEFHRRSELQWVDSCAKPNSEPMERLWPDRRELSTILVPGAGAKGGAVSLEAKVAARLRAALRSGENGHRPAPVSTAG
ncbi:MAG TPA: GNAT family N-acetyltransferase [Solirubrobacterales bacterium]|jgi:CelD/BcsL family acetyltransferase involved in cellulose biosynthesis